MSRVVCLTEIEKDCDMYQTRRIVTRVEAVNIETQSIRAIRHRSSDVDPLEEALLAVKTAPRSNVFIVPGTSG